MEKKFKFTDNPNLAKIIYGVVVAILCVTAIIIGIVAANNRKNDELPTVPPSVDENEQNPPSDENDNTPPDSSEDKTPEVKQTFISPVVGSVTKNHSLTVPVFSQTLEEWRVHAGIDISTEESAPVFATCAGEITKVYNHPMLGTTIEITHDNGFISVYSNLSSDTSSLATIGANVEQGEQIGVIGDTSISELAEETHLHFELKQNSTYVDPLGYLTEESKEASLGIKS